MIKIQNVLKMDGAKVISCMMRCWFYLKKDEMDEMEKELRSTKPEMVVTWLHKQRSPHNYRLVAALQTHLRYNEL